MSRDRGEVIIAEPKHDFAEEALRSEHRLKYQPKFYRGIDSMSRSIALWVLVVALMVFAFCAGVIVRSLGTVTVSVDVPAVQAQALYAGTGFLMNVPDEVYETEEVTA